MDKSPSDIKASMTNNRLKLNDSKTVLLIIVAASHNKAFCNAEVKIANDLAESTNNAGSLGVVFDKNMTLNNEIAIGCGTCMYHHRNVGAIRHLIAQTCKTCFTP